ncbi:polysaccharide biosynthesis/export family protein [Comamonadaceae bacterium G21597-S1]|nr:polysaccharide biosynthesis/export family protein [Comamonadaceae bacterium G21597-S1]
MTFIPRFLRPLHVLGICAAAFVLSACTAPTAKQAEQAVPPAVMESSLRYQKQYLLTAGDQLDIVVWRTPEVSRSVVIRSDGQISLPLLQDVTAAGLTTRELADKLTQLLSARFVDPQVAVVPTQVRQPMVYVLGDVGTPAAVPLRNAATALQALAAAGGVRKSGAEADVTVIRLMESGRLRAIAVQGPDDGQPAPYLTLAAMPLQADDIVFVPENGRSQVSRFLDDIVLKPLQVFLTFRIISDN